MLNPEKLRSLRELFSEKQHLVKPAQLAVYQMDAGMDAHLPEGVVLPESTADLQHLARWAQQHQVPLIARGAGTGYTGGSVAIQGGVLVSFTRMSTILEIDDLSRQAVVQPGVVNNQLQQALLPLGLYYPPDPASQSVCTLGGNIAENAGGPHCLKYGVTSNYVMGIEIVMADGAALQLGGKVFDPPEYDFTGLITGSEGTLALISAATLKLRSPYQDLRALTACFVSVAQAGEAVSAVIAAGLQPATIELMDNGMINIVEDYLHAGLPRQAGAILIFDVEGYPNSLEKKLSEITTLINQYQPLEMKLAHTPEERELLWRARRSAAGAVSRISPDEYLVDVSVPRSRLSEALQAISSCGQQHGYRVCYLAHAGDGNLHPNLLCDFSIPGERERVLEAAGNILRLCAALGGSIGGEHGIGVEKREFLPAMYSRAEISAMLEVRDLFDPDGLMNPGKIFPPESRVHPPTPGQGGQIPGSYFEPTNAEEAAGGLRALQAAQQPTYIAGGRSQWVGDAPAGTLLSSAGLQGISVISTADQYVTVRAGTSLCALQQELFYKGFFAAVEHLGLESTAGGVIAANTNAPLRFLYGGLRDQVLAVQVALPDGRVLRFGRPLVKDVAGYQMSKLFTGSYGTLGLIIEVTLKLLPLPRARASLAIRVANLQQGLLMGLEALRHAINCSGIVLMPGTLSDAAAPGHTLLYTAEGHFDDVTTELSLVRVALEKLGQEAIFEIVETSASQEWQRRLQSTARLRAAVPPRRLPELCHQVGLSLPDHVSLIDITNGLLFIPVQVDQLYPQLAVLQQSANDLDGYAVLAAGPRALFLAPAAWGTARPPRRLMQRLKLRWDPGNILNRHEFIQ
jgi:D-lactate dehydrogenase (cytochrome)